MYPSETDKKTTTSRTVENTVDSVIELLRERPVDGVIPSIALAATAAAVDESISALCVELINSWMLLFEAQVNGTNLWLPRFRGSSFFFASSSSTFVGSNTKSLI